MILTNLAENLGLEEKEFSEIFELFLPILVLSIKTPHCLSSYYIISI